MMTNLVLCFGLVLSGAATDEEPPAAEPQDTAVAGEGADLAPLLALWDKELAPVLVKRLLDPSREVRLKALLVLDRVEIYGESLLPVVMELLQAPDSEIAQAAAQWLLEAPREPTVQSLLTFMHRDGLKYHVVRRVLPLLARLVPARGKERTVMLGRKDCAFLARALHSPELGAPGVVVRLLLSQGSEGVKWIVAGLKKCSPVAAERVLDYTWSRAGKASTVLREYAIGQAKSSKDPLVVQVCRRLLFSGVAADDLPVDLLKEAFLEERGSLRIKALEKLAEKGEDAIGALADMLDAEDREVVQGAAFTLLDLHFTLLSPDAARKAMTAARTYLRSCEPGEVLCNVAVALGVETSSAFRARYWPPALSTGELAGFRSSRSSRASASKIRGRRGERRVVRLDRVTAFLPAVKACYREGERGESHVAERVLLKVFVLARKIDKKRQEEEKAREGARKGAEEKPPERRRGSPLRGKPGLSRSPVSPGAPRVSPPTGPIR